MTKEERYALIEKYLTGQLTADEQADFENRRQEDAAFAGEVDLHEKAQQYLGGEKIHDFRKVLQEVDQDWQAPGNRPGRLFSLNRMLAAAAVILLLMAAAWFLFRQDAATSETLFAEHFSPYTMVLNQRSNDMSRELMQAVEAYQQERYASAADQFSRLSERKPENKAVRFYGALSHLAAGNAREAIQTLQVLVNSPDEHLLKEQSRWYLALAYLKVNEKMQAKTILTQIPKGSFQYETAQELTEKLQ